MLKLAIDIGNTAIKCALFEQQQIVGKLVFTQLLGAELSDFFAQHGTPQSAIVSNVRSEEIVQPFLTVLQRFVRKIWVVDPTMKTPLLNLYQTPQTLGCDRLAAAVGANFLYPQRNLLIINAGTALTYELVSEQGEYLGGNISLGLQSRFLALHHLTGKLPLCAPVENPVEIGRTTHEAIAAGVQNGMLYEMQVNIDQFSLKYSKLKVLLTGGDTIFFENQLKNTTFVVHDLVLIGLNRIIDYHASLD